MNLTAKPSMYTFFRSNLCSLATFAALHSLHLTFLQLWSGLKLGCDLVSVRPYMKENYKYHLSPLE